MEDVEGQIEPRLLTLEQVAQLLAVRPAQVYALVRAGDLPALKLGGRGVWRVDRRQLDAYLDRVAAETAEWVKTNPIRAVDAELEDFGDAPAPSKRAAAPWSARQSH